MRLKKIKKVTSGKRHAWVETDLGFDIRKPLNKLKIAFENLPAEIIKVRRMKWWEKILNKLKTWHLTRSN